MDSAFLDKESWRRALRPTIRVVIYTTIIYVFIFIIGLILFWLINSITGDPAVSANMVSMFGLLFLLIGFALSIFKVLDEDRPGEIQFEMT